MKTERRNQLPKARRDQLIIKELPDEVLVYDLERDKAHCLNQTAALVWKNCDGKKTVAQLHEVMEKNAGGPLPEDMIWLALDQLETFQLLDEAPEKPFQLTGISRRSLVKRIGFAALAVPAIISIAAPSAQAQASGAPPGACCTTNANCASGKCANGGSCTPPPTKICMP